MLTTAGEMLFFAHSLKQKGLFESKRRCNWVNFYLNGE